MIPGSTGRQKFTETGEYSQTPESKEPRKTNVLRGSTDSCAYLHPGTMGAEGLEPNGYNAGKTALSEIAGAQAGAIDSDFDVQGHFKTQAIDDLQTAWEALKRLIDQSDSPAESRAAGRALAFIDRAFEELESGK